MKLTLEQIKSFLPHRKPFLFVDSVSEIITPQNFNYNGDAKSLIGCQVVAHFKVTHDLEILAGHFPNNPVLPGVVQVEMMAQAASMLFVLTEDNLKDIKVDVALVGIDKAKFRHPVVPPMDLKIISKLTRVRGHMVSYDCQLFHQDQVVSEVSVFASLKVL